MNNLEQAINLKVKVTTLLDQPTTGHIYAYSSVHEVLTLRLTNNYVKNSQNKNESYKFINTAFIKTIQVLPPFPRRINSPPPATQASTSSAAINSKLNSNSPPPAPASPQLTQLSINELESLLNKSVAQYKEMVSISQSHNASNIAVMLFEKLYSNFGGNVKWGPYGSIIVEDEIKIAKPYLAKSGTISKVNSNSGDSKKLDKVFEIVKEYWQTIENDKIGG